MAHLHSRISGYASVDNNNILLVVEFDYIQLTGHLVMSSFQICGAVDCGLSHVLKCSNTYTEPLCNVTAITNFGDCPHTTPCGCPGSTVVSLVMNRANKLWKKYYQVH